MSFIGILKKYNVEPILFFYYTAAILYYPTPFTKLVADKLCIHKYNLTLDFCYHINLKENAKTLNATQVTSDAAHYILYRTLIISIPSILAALFVGPWLDQHKLAPKIVLVLTAFAGLFEAVCVLFSIIFFDLNVTYLLLSPILSGITGGEMLFITACFVYATKETPLDERTFRFVILEFAMVLPSPTANLISGFVLPIEPYFKHQVRNYLPLISIAIGCYIICLAFICLIGEPKEVYSSKDTVLKRASSLSLGYLTMEKQISEESNTPYVNKTFENDVSVQVKEDDRKNNNISLDDSNFSEQNVSFDKIAPLPIMTAKKTSKTEIFKSLFKLKNAIEIFRSVIKRREDEAHILLWMVIFVYLNLLMSAHGLNLIMVLFNDKTYHWPLDYFQKIEASGYALVGFMTTFVVSYLHKIKLEDTKIIAIGITSLFLKCFFKGIILNPVGYFIAYALGSVFLCGLVGCRGFVTKIIPETELGSVLCAMSVIYAVAPVFSSPIYTTIFTLSLDTNPGLIFLFASAELFLNMIVLVCLHFKYMKFKAKMNIKKLISDN